jgi:hypothetical protein
VSEATHAYVARRTCGHPIALIVDLPDDPKGTAKAVAEQLRAGHKIERVTIPEARDIGVVYCSCSPPKKKRRKDPKMFTPGAIKRR